MLDQELLKGVGPNIRQNNKAKRANYDRKPLFKVYPMVEPPLLEPQKTGNPTFGTPNIQLLVKAISFLLSLFSTHEPFFDYCYVNFSMHLGDAEPFYGEMFLYLSFLVYSNER